MYTIGAIPFHILFTCSEALQKIYPQVLFEFAVNLLSCQPCSLLPSARALLEGAGMLFAGVSGYSAGGISVSFPTNVLSVGNCPNRNLAASGSDVGKDEITTPNRLDSGGKPSLLAPPSVAFVMMGSRVRVT